MYLVVSVQTVAPLAATGTAMRLGGDLSSGLHVPRDDHERTVEVAGRHKGLVLSSDGLRQRGQTSSRGRHQGSLSFRRNGEAGSCRQPLHERPSTSKNPRHLLIAALMLHLDHE